MAVVWENKLKKAAGKGQVQWGMYSATLNPELIELAGFRSLFDFLVIDLEHSVHYADKALDCMRAADVVGLTPLVRVPGIDPAVVMKVLDAGAQGIVFPGISTRDEAIRAVQSAKFPPEGARGAVSNVRGMRYVTGAEFGKQAEITNRETMVVLLPLESREGIENLEDILSVPGVDMISLSPGDLSQALGHPGDFNHPEVIAAQEKAIAACKRRGIAVYAPAPTREMFEQWYAQGIRVFSMGDMTLFQMGLQAFKAVREARK